MPDPAHIKNTFTAQQKKFFSSKRFVILMGSIIALDPLSIDMYLPAFPTMTVSLNTSYSMLELSVTSFFIGMVIGQLFFGPVADHLGRRKTLLIGMVVYFFATLGCALSSNIYIFIFFRILQAFGGCAGMVVTRAIARDIFDSKKFAGFFSTLMLVMGLAPILAPTLGSMISAHLGWRSIFYVLAAINLICWITSYFFVPETQTKQSTSTLHIAKAFRSYTKLLQNVRFTGYAIPDSVIRGGYFAYVAGSPFVFIEIFKIPSQHYAWLFALNSIGFVLASQFNRFFLRKYYPDQILRVARWVASLSAVVLVLAPMIHFSFWTVWIPIFFFISSLGFVGPNSGALALSEQGHQAGLASALYGTLQWTFPMISTYAVAHLHNETIYPMTGVIASCAVIGVIGFYLMIGRQTSKKSPKIPMVETTIS